MSLQDGRVYNAFISYSHTGDARLAGRPIDQASRYLHLWQLALSQQCGFASSLCGNLVSEGDQFRKFDVMLEAAAKV